MLPRPLLACAAALAALALAAPAAAQDAEAELAERYAPVVRLVEQEEECGPGEPYEPLDVEALFDEPTVALRGPWGNGDLIEVGPGAGDLTDRLYEYHLDFPGNALDPGCSYELWARRVSAGEAPAVYAHVVPDGGRLALQYWLFYAFNDWNNLHEGDWEMIQLVFDAPDAASALAADPVEVGYSQHEGAERADWDDEKLELVDGTHPVVHPAAGSHANFYEEGLYLGTSGSTGVGCDNTLGPTRDLRPAVHTIPGDPAAAGAAFPWIGFAGRWGELQPSFYNGPTGPNLKTQWAEPILWAEEWRDKSYAVPAGGTFGTGATDFFCTAVESGSNLLRLAVNEPAPVILALLVLALLLLLGISRATWTPTAPLHAGRRRAWGQILAASARLYRERPLLLVGIGLVFVPVSLLVTALQALVLEGSSVLGIRTEGESGGFLVLLAVALGTSLTLLGVGFVQAATARTLLELDAGRPAGPLHAYRLALPSVRPLLGAIAIAVVVVTLLATSLVLLPVAIWLAVRLALIAPAVELEDLSATAALRRSWQLVRGDWLKVGSLTLVGAGLTLVAGPLAGAVLILLTSAPFALLNVVAGLVYVFAMPFVGLTTAYVYLDLRARDELEPESAAGVLPAEIELTA